MSLGFPLSPFPFPLPSWGASAPAFRPAQAYGSHGAAASEGNLSFRDTSAWRDRSIVYRLISRVTPNFTGRSTTGPRPIRHWTAWAGLNLWRAALRHNGVQSPQRAAGPVDEVRIHHPDGSVELQEKSEKFGTIEDDGGSKFNWAFSQKVELRFDAGSGSGPRSNEQKLVGFAYKVTQQPEGPADDPIKKLNALDAGLNPSEYLSTSVPDFTKNDRPVVVIFGGHGVPVEQMSRGGFLGGCVGKTYVDRLQANVLALNYRGYGQSTSGITSNRSMVEDGIAIVNHLLESGVDSRRIVLHGYSMGGNIAANVLQAVEANKKVLGGLILDRSMEKLSTGAASMSATKSSKIPNRLFCNYFLSPIAQLVAYCLAESYSTRLAIKGIFDHRKALANDPDSLERPKNSTPIVAVYDDDPIGSTTKRMCEKYKIENWETGAGHSEGVGATLTALTDLRDEMLEKNVKNSNVWRLFKVFEVEPHQTAKTESDPGIDEITSESSFSSTKEEDRSVSGYGVPEMFFSGEFNPDSLRSQT
ncbi:alpha/beta hydrolase fold protein [Labrenzia sp. THAF82]|nr:alpha/beta hydrolase fold protein [Labrenzia sp. THAF82]